MFFRGILQREKRFPICREQVPEERLSVPPHKRLIARHDQVARALLTAVLYAAPILMCLYASASIADPDIWWHLRTGEWIMQHHTVPHTDPFSAFGAGKPWQAYSWLFELVAFKAYQWFDLSGIMAYTATMVLAITIALHRLMQRLQPDFTKATLLTMSVMICLSRLYTPRPWLFTILFFVLEIDLLMQARKSGATRELFWLPLIFALWANIHIQFIDGLLVLGVAACEPALRRWRTQGQLRVSAHRLRDALRRLYPCHVRKPIWHQNLQSRVAVGLSAGRP